MSTTLKFYVSTDRKRKTDQQLPIYIRVIHLRKKAEGKLSVIPISEIDLVDWNSDLQRFNSKKEKLIQYNIFLNELQNEFHNYLRSNVSQMAKISAKDIRDHLLSRNFCPETKVIQAVNDYYKNIIEPDADKALGTKKNYKKSINHFVQFLKHKKLLNTTVKNFKRKHASMFVDYLKSDIPLIDKKALNSQTANSIAKNIRPIFKKLYLDEEIMINPFDGVSVPFKKAVKPRLTNDYYKNIISLDLTKKPVLDVYRDYFLMMCYTGLSHCDLFNLRDYEITKGRIEIRRKKSKVLTIQMLNNKALSIIDKYEGQIPEQRIIPKKSLDKVNQNLKLIGVLAGVHFPLTTYAGRRFFRQSIYESGIHEELVRKSLMGHSVASDMDSHYFLITDSILMEAKDKLDSHFNSLNE